MSLWTLGIPEVVKAIGGYVAGRQAIKADKAAAVAVREEILTRAAAQDSAVAGQIALANTENQNNTWKDEYALLVITGPVVLLMLLASVEALGFVPLGTTGSLATAMFGVLGQVPEWWANTFQMGIWAAMGITGFKKLLK